MTLRAFLIGTLTALAVISCGGGGGNVAGGIGGTGISYGPVTGFGSVIVNGTEFETGSASFSKDGASTTQAGLGVGMVVSVTHDSNGNAKSVSYKDNAEGPVAGKVDLDGTNGSFEVLGISVTVDSLTKYEGTPGITALANGDIVEVSGHITGNNSVLATRVEKKGTCATLGVGDEIEAKGTITSIIDADSFTIGSLTVNYSNGPTGLQVGDYVEVKSDDCPLGNTLTASSVELEDEGADLSDLDEGESEMEIKGIIANFIANPCSFTVNGQLISTSVSCAGLANGTFVEVHGKLDSSNVLVASEINNEDGDEEVDDEFKGIVTVVTKSSSFIGTISVQGVTGTFTTNLNTRFDGNSQTFNLDTLQAGPTCAEVKVNSADEVLVIEEESSSDCAP